MKLRTLLLGLIYAWATTSAFAQVPETDIWLVEVNPHYKGIDILVNEPTHFARNITGFHPYENQPHFTPDGKSILYTAIGSDGQADIFSYDLASGLTTQLTNTPESEYSPMITPDGKHISVVRVEMDSTQRLWQFDLNGRNPEVLFPEQKQIGYYAWAGPGDVFCFLVTEPFTLVRLREGKPAEHIADSVGRCIQKIPNDNAISYVVKHHDSNVVKRYDLEHGTSLAIFPCQEKGEDIAWLNGAVLQATGNKIWLVNPNYGDAFWMKFTELNSKEANDLYRIAVSPDGQRIAVVNRKTNP